MVERRYWNMTFVFAVEAVVGIKPPHIPPGETGLKHKEARGPLVRRKIGRR